MALATPTISSAVREPVLGKEVVCEGPADGHRCDVLRAPPIVAVPRLHALVSPLGSQSSSPGLHALQPPLGATDVLTPFKNLATPIAIVMWGHVYTSLCYNEQDMDAFIMSRYRRAFEDWPPSGAYEYLWQGDVAQACRLAASLTPPHAHTPTPPSSRSRRRLRLRIARGDAPPALDPT